MYIADGRRSQGRGLCLWDEQHAHEAEGKLRVGEFCSGMCWQWGLFILRYTGPVRTRTDGRIGPRLFEC